MSAVDESRQPAANGEHHGHGEPDSDDKHLMHPEKAAHTHAGQSGASTPSGGSRSSSSSHLGVAMDNVGESSSSAPAGASQHSHHHPRLPKRSERQGHRKVDKRTGEVSYKSVKTNELMQAIQMGLRQAIGHTMQTKRRDLLLQDFEEVEYQHYPKEGTAGTPAHRFQPFSFYAYAPRAYRHFREAFDIDTADFLLSLCEEPLRELSNPGASGSLFWLSHDDQFILKTVQKNESKFLQKLLPGYYMQLHQNRRTLLPKFYGHFCYKSSSGRHIRFIVMNNLLPSVLHYHQRFDLKGSTFRRFASAKELKKSSPTYKDLDFLRLHRYGIRLHPDTYERLCSTIHRDCLLLESFKIMDYSLLLGVHNTAEAASAAEGAPSEPMLELRGSCGLSFALHGIYQRISSQEAVTPIYQRQEPFDGEEVMNLSSSTVRAHQPERASYLLQYNEQAVQWEIVHPDSKLVVAQCQTDMLSLVTSDSPWFVLEKKAFVMDRSLAVLPHIPTEKADGAIGVQLRESVGLHEKRRPQYWKNRQSRYKPVAIPEDIDPAGPVAASEHAAAKTDAPPASHVANHGGLAGYNERGERVILFIGIIDILQSYVRKKALEHTYKALIHDGDKVSVHRPGFYSQRFQEFMMNVVFRPLTGDGNELGKRMSDEGPKGYRLVRQSSFEDAEQRKARAAAGGRDNGDHARSGRASTNPIEVQLMEPGESSSPRPIRRTSSMRSRSPTHASSKNRDSSRSHSAHRSDASPARADGASAPGDASHTSDSTSAGPSEYPSSAAKRNRNISGSSSRRGGDKVGSIVEEPSDDEAHNDPLPHVRIQSVDSESTRSAGDSKDTSENAPTQAQGNVEQQRHEDSDSRDPPSSDEQRGQPAVAWGSVSAHRVVVVSGTHAAADASTEEAWEETDDVTDTHTSPPRQPDPNMVTTTKHVVLRKETVIDAASDDEESAELNNSMDTSMLESELI